MAIAQTPDGYLWLGTEYGLLRFDGVRHVPWQPPSDQQLPSTSIWSLLAARDGSLWIGTAKGLAKWKDGKLTKIAELDGQYIFKILEDHEGVIWASSLTVTTGKLCTIKESFVHCDGDDGSLGHGAFTLFEDSNSNLWAGVKNGLWRFRPGPPKFYPLPGEPDGIRAIGEDVDGTLLVGWNGGIYRFFDGQAKAYSLSGITGRFRAKRILRDRDGGLWIGTSDRGLVHAYHGKADMYGNSEGLSADNIYALFEDREKNIWVATINGLDRFRDFAVVTFGRNEGPMDPIVSSVLAARDGTILLGRYAGLTRWTNGSFATLGHDGKLNGHNPNSLFQDDSGRIWVSTPVGFGYLQDDGFHSVSTVPGAVTGMTQDTAGNLWIANEHASLFRLRRAVVEQQIAWTDLGHKDPASALVADPSRGGLWIGFNLGGIAYFKDNQIRESYAPTDGFVEGRVNYLHFDRNGSLWTATDGGLSRLKDGRLTTLTSKNGLPCDTIHWVIEDTADSVWLKTACGLVRIKRSELDNWIAAVTKDKDAKPSSQFMIFDTSDGVRSGVSSSHFSPQVTQSEDGRLWFSGPEGVNVVDPNHLPFNNLPPAIQVEQLIADRKTYEATNGGLRLPPLIRDLQIDYTALSFVAPEKNLFRYKLEPRDHDWQEVTTRRQVFYNDLPPGNYRFRVMACNNSGVWNEAGTSLDFSIDPAYYQTMWFRVAALMVFLLGLVGIYQLRLRQVARQVRGRMEERLEERERIARDLHDTLLQGVQGLILKFHAVSRQIPTDTPAYQALEKTLDHADQVLAEGRDRIQNLRVNSASLSDLPAAFRSVAEETSQGGDATFKTVVEGRVRALHPLVLEECYCIGREAIINALSHSNAQQIEAEITYDSRHFRLRIRDNGQGIDPKILEAGGRSGHWGLQGMQERSQKIGGQLRFWSRPETGTEVELTVPGATAYQRLSNKPKKLRFSGFFDGWNKNSKTDA